MQDAITINVTKIPPPAMQAHCRTLLNCIGSFFDNPDNQNEFEAWHVKQYGHPPREASYMEVKVK